MIDTEQKSILTTLSTIIEGLWIYKWYLFPKFNDNKQKEKKSPFYLFLMKNTKNGWITGTNIDKIVAIAAKPFHFNLYNLYNMP